MEAYVLNLLFSGYRFWQGRKCGELRGKLLARILLQLQKMLPQPVQQTFRNQRKRHLLSRLRQQVEAKRSAAICASSEIQFYILLLQSLSEKYASNEIFTKHDALFLNAFSPRGN